MTGSATITGGLPIVYKGITFTPDYPLDVAGRGLFGAVITCSYCRAQFGPVRSKAEAFEEIQRHAWPHPCVPSEREVEPRPAIRPPVPPCSAEGCGRPSKARGLCSMHYSRRRRIEMTA